MPFGVNTYVPPPVINSVAGGAEGSLLKKRITKELCDEFPQQECFANVKSFIEACALSVEGAERPLKAVVSDGGASTSGDGSSERPVASAASAAAATALLRDSPLKPFLTSLTSELFPALHRYVDAIPLHDMKAQRFGNKAFREFCQKMGDELLESVVKKHVMPAIEALAAANNGNGNNNTVAGNDKDTTVVSPAVDEAAPTTTTTTTSSSTTAPPLPATVANELYEYLLDSFGNAQRIDYGTGHELHFMCFCYVAIVRINYPNLKDEAFKRGLADLVLVVFSEYIAFCRRLQQHYSLEPAGSHGVWGLDDYHHLPLLFGASQLVGTEPAVLPKHITERDKVQKLRPRYLYFDMIGWIIDNKKGPFHEHSPILYNVSGLEEWSRIRGGMLKMYVAEVMSRFAVVQHFLFGPTIAWK